MTYIKLTEDKWIEVDETRNTSRIIVKSELAHEADFLNQRIEELPQITDEYLLEWAKKNYSQSEEIKERVRMSDRLIEVNSLLEKLI